MPLAAEFGSALTGAIRGEVGKVIARRDEVCGSGAAAEHDVECKAAELLAGAKELGARGGPLSHWEQYGPDKEPLVTAECRYLQDVFDACEPGAAERTQDEVLRYQRAACAVVSSADMQRKGTWVRADTDGGPLAVLESEAGSRCDAALRDGLAQMGSRWGHAMGTGSSAWPEKLRLDFDGATWQAVWEEGWYLVKEIAGDREARLIRIAGGGEEVERDALRARHEGAKALRDAVTARRHSNGVTGEMNNTLEWLVQLLDVQEQGLQAQAGDARDVAAGKRLLHPVLRELERRAAAPRSRADADAELRRAADIADACAVADFGDLHAPMSDLYRDVDVAHVDAGAHPPPAESEAAAALRARAADAPESRDEGGFRFPVLWDGGSGKGVFATYRALLGLTTAYTSLLHANKERLGGRMGGVGTGDEERAAREETRGNADLLRLVQTQRAELHSCITELGRGTETVLASNQREREDREKLRGEQRDAYAKKKEECEGLVVMLCQRLLDLKGMGEDCHDSTVAIDVYQKAAAEMARRSERVAEKLRGDLATMDRTIRALEQHVCPLQSLTVDEALRLRDDRENYAGNECREMMRLTYDTAKSSARVARDYAWDPKRGERANCRLLQPRIDQMAVDLAAYPADSLFVATQWQHLEVMRMELRTRDLQCTVTEEHFEHLARMYAGLTRAIPSQRGDPFAAAREDRDRAETERRVRQTAEWMLCLSDCATKLKGLVSDMEEDDDESGSENDLHDGILDTLRDMHALLVDGDLPRYLLAGGRAVLSGRAAEYQAFKDAMVRHAGGAGVRLLRKAPKRVTDALKGVAGSPCDAVQQLLREVPIEQYDGQTVAQAWEGMFLPTICSLGLDMGVTIGAPPPAPAAAGAGQGRGGAGAPLVCPQQHPMMLCTSAHEWRCTKCGKHHPEESKVFHCTMCRYDHNLCAGCDPRIVVD